MRADLIAGPHDPLPPASRGAPYDIVFLDRDDTINRRIPGDWVRAANQLELIPGAAAAVARLNAAGCRVVVVTNQRGLATGAITPEGWSGVCSRLEELLAEDGARVDDTAVCPHERGVCDCRKPAPGLILEVLAAASWARPERCLLIGDAASDLEAARASGVPARLLGVDDADLSGAVRAVLGSDPRGAYSPPGHGNI